MQVRLRFHSSACAPPCIVLSHSIRNFLIPVCYRARHKKCDETRPICVNCLSTGRKCDGYAEVQLPNKKTYAASNESGTESGSNDDGDFVFKTGQGLKLARTMVEPGKGGLSTHERFFLNFFRTEGAFEATGPPYDILINGVARQFGAWQPAVRHATIALAARDKFFKRYWEHSGREPEKLFGFVSGQTSKSITHLLQQPMPEGLTDRRAHRELVFITCMILTCLANCQDDHATLQMHVMHAQRAMREWEEAGFDNSSIGGLLFQAMSDMEFRLKSYYQPALFLQDDHPLLLRAAWDMANFNISYFEHNVNRYWDIWSPLILSQLPEGYSPAALDDSDSVLRTWKVSAMYKPRIWARQLSAYIQFVGPLVPQSLQDLLTMLRLWEQAMCAKMSAAMAADEDPVFKPLQMRYDIFWTYFGRINEFSKKLLQSQIRQDISEPAFPIDRAVIAPLFFCGLHCRDWSIRREALRLVKAWSERFKGSSTTASLPMMLSALERIIDMESVGLQPGSVVPESARIYFVKVTGRPGSSNIDFSYRGLVMSRVDEIQ